MIIKLCILIAILCSSCATDLNSLTHNEKLISVGDKYEINLAAVRFANRGYIDSIEPAEEIKEYDPYYKKLVAEISVGTSVEIVRIYKTFFKERIFITALLGGEKVNITPLIKPNN